jgi:hypothetical protein
LHGPAFADLEHQTVEEDHGVDVVERSLLPGADASVTRLTRSQPTFTP